MTTMEKVNNDWFKDFLVFKWDDIKWDTHGTFKFDNSELEGDKEWHLTIPKNLM